MIDTALTVAAGAIALGVPGIAAVILGGRKERERHAANGTEHLLDIGTEPIVDEPASCPAWWHDQLEQHLGDFDIAQDAATDQVAATLRDTLGHYDPCLDIDDEVAVAAVQATLALCLNLSTTPHGADSINRLFVASGRLR